MYKRELKSVLQGLRNYKHIMITGPRGSGKTTLVRTSFPQHHYVSLDDTETYEAFKKSPRAFFQQYKKHPHGLIIDEWQKMTATIDDLRGINKDYRGMIIFVGTHNIFTNAPWWYWEQPERFVVMPLSLQERVHNGLSIQSLSECMLTQGIMAFQKDSVLTLQDAYDRYLVHYMEDMRSIILPHQRDDFIKFLQECAASIGEHIDYEDFAKRCNIKKHIVKLWFALLEQTHMIFLMNPEIECSSRLYDYSMWCQQKKKPFSLYCEYPEKLFCQHPPKLYFFDTGLSIFLLKEHEKTHLQKSIFYKQLFENFIVSDLCKQFYHRGEQPALHYGLFLQTQNAAPAVATCVIKQRIPLVITTDPMVDEAIFPLQAWFNSDWPRYYANVIREILHEVRKDERGCVVHDGSIKVNNRGKPSMLHHDIIAWKLVRSIGLNWIHPPYQCHTPFQYDTLYRTSLYRRLVSEASDAWKCTCDQEFYGCNCECVNEAYKGLDNPEEQPSVYGVTPLHEAAHSGNVNQVEFLLQHKVNLNAQTIQGNTPLFYAVEKSHAIIEDILIAAEADITVVNYQNCTLLDVARHYNNHRMVNFLLKQGIHANHMNIQPREDLCPMNAL